MQPQASIGILDLERRPRDRAVVLALCVLLHLVLFWLLNAPAPNRAYAVPLDDATFEPAVVWIPVSTPGELEGRALGPPTAQRRERPNPIPIAIHGQHGEVGKAPNGAPSGNQLARSSGNTHGDDGGPAQAESDPLATPDPKPAESTPAATASPAGTGAAPGAPIDWEAARERVAREIARRYSAVDDDGDAVGADGRSPSGLMAEGDGTGRPNCGKIYSGSAILGNGMYQYDGDPQHGCEWRR